MKNSLDNIGNAHIQLLIQLGEHIAKYGTNSIHTSLGMTKADTTRARTLYQFKTAVNDCSSVVQALQVCGSERDRIRTANQKPSKVKALTPDELKAKRAKDLAENSEHGSYRAMTAL